MLAVAEICATRRPRPSFRYLGNLPLPCHIADHGSEVVLCITGSVIPLKEPPQLSRRKQSRKSSYRHPVPHRKFPFVDLSRRPRVLGCERHALPGRMPPSARCSGRENRPQEIPSGEAFTHQYFVAPLSSPLQRHDKVIMEAANRWRPIAPRLCVEPPAFQ